MVITPYGSNEGERVVLMDEDGIYLLPEAMTKEDLEQENKLRELEGRKKVSKRTLKMRELGYGLVVPVGAQRLWKTDPPDLEVIEKLSAWLLRRAEHIQMAVLDYLDDPNHEQFVAVLSMIDRKFTLRMRKKGVTLMELILNSLPSTIDDLVVMARREHKSKRPEAAVRQNIRNLIKRKEVWIDEEGVHHYIYERRKKNPKSSGRNGKKRKTGRPRATRTVGSYREEEERRRKDKDTRKATKKKRRKSSERLLSSRDTRRPKDRAS